MNYIARPQFRYVVIMTLAVCVIALVMVSVLMPAVKFLASESTSKWPPVTDLIHAMAMVFPPLFLILFSCFYCFGRKRSWIISPEGIEIRNDKELLHHFSWEEILYVKLARFTVGVRVRKKPYDHYLNFIDRDLLRERIPDEKQYVVSQL